MGLLRRGALQRAWLAFLVWTLLVGTVAVVGEGTAAAAGQDGRPEWVEDLETGGIEVDTVPWEESRSAELPETEGVPAAEVTFPDPAAWEVSLGREGEGSVIEESLTDDAVAVDELPVEVVGGAGETSGGALAVEVFDRPTAERTGVSGFVFGISGGSAVTGSASERVGPEDGRGEGGSSVDLEIDYGDFADAHGGDYASRLQLVALPACAVERPPPDRCDLDGVALEDVENDLEAGTLTATVDLADLAGEGGAVAEEDEFPGLTAEERDAIENRSDREVHEPWADEARRRRTEGADIPEELEPFESTDEGDALGTTGPAVASRAEGAQDPGSSEPVGDLAVLAVTASTSGGAGEYAATPLSGTGDWNVGPGTGEFSYSYPFDLPAPPGGSAPSVGLGYSSGSVDGLTNVVNTQASQTGLGWSEPANAFIERRYEPCYQGQTLNVNDLCWKGHSDVSISLAGVSGTLIPLDEDFETWRVQGDPGWLIERIGDPEGDDTPGVSNAEYWMVTAPDGTEYHFGRHWNPDTGEWTGSEMWVPVWGDDPGEPNCHEEEGVERCPGMPWRWMLDRVVDPDGNVTSYYYEREMNHYDGFADADARYVRSVALKRVDYGAREGSDAPPAARVNFGRQYRCNHLDATCESADNDTPGQTFPDVPTDLVCGQGQTCGSDAPSFFSTKRYSHVRTEVRVDGEWKAVKQYNLYHTLHAGGSTSPELRPKRIVEVGLARDRFDVLPSTDFTYTFFANRVDNGGDPAEAMQHYRLTRVRNPYGGTTEVTYGFNRECAEDYVPRQDDLDRWDLNDRDCFPQTSVDGGIRNTAVFHKYLVTEIVESAGHGSPDITTTYDYGMAGDEDPGWAFNTSSYGSYSHEWGWSNWRGYGTVTIDQGLSRTRLRQFRGMDGDTMLKFENGELVPEGEREVDIESFDGSHVVPDDPALVGRTLEEQKIGTVDGVADEVVESSLHTYTTSETAAPFSPDYDAPTWAGVETITESVATAPGEFDQRRSHTTYNEDLQPATTLEEGWLDVSGDERCSTTTYATDPAAWMFTYPAENVTVAGDCESTDELSRTETYYDGSSTLGELPGPGNATSERTRMDGSTWSPTSTTYDDLGRPVEVTGPNGATTTTTYTSSAPNLVPTEIATTNDLGHTETRTMFPTLQLPSKIIDVNGNRTDPRYDGLGRMTNVRLPTEQPFTGDEKPSWRFSYDIDPDKEEPPVVRSRQLTSDAMSGSGVNWEESWVVYDSMMRQRQTHAQSAEAGEVVVSETTYDGRGLARDATAAQSVAGTPGDGLLSPAEWDNRTRNLYDELGRPTSEQWWRGGTVAHETTTAYGADQVTVTSPDGSQVRETVDGLGRTVEVAEHDGTDWVASTYEYDLADNLVSATDPAGNTISYTYNMAGLQLTQDDPNRGSATFTYDAAGNQLSVVDGNGNEIHSVYDELGRQTERRAGSPTGDLLASWEYDTAPGGVGMVHRETRHTGDGDWVTEVDGYDGRGRSLGSTLTVPAGIPGLSGSYTTSQTYDRADRVTSVTYPAVGGLPQETVTTGYDDLGLAQDLTGLEDYVWGVDYDDRGRVTGSALGPPSSGEPWMARSWEYNDDQQMSRTETYVAGSGAPDGIVSDHRLAFDDAGKLESKVTMLDGGSWRECFGYDGRQRMIEAYTVEEASSCSEGDPGTGDNPYTQSFTYAADGRLLEQADDLDPDPGDVTSYDYPASGEDLPHAPTDIGDETYTWDDAGNLAQRTVDGGTGTETFTWDAEQRLASVDGPDGTTSFVYDAGGQRLLRTTDDGSTLYVAGHEVTASADGSQVSAVRSYTFAGSMVATRNAGGVDYLVSGAGGSVEMAIPSSGTPSGTRAYEPYGEVRAESGDEFATDRGFIGQIEDSTTNLSYLNARYYDTTVGVFLSTDPLYDKSKPKSLNPYTYAAGNPATMADPSGLSPGYIHGLEVENAELKRQNTRLVGHIKKLNNQIDSLQGIIKKQNRTIDKLVDRVDALKAVVRQQQTIINRLADKVRYLVGVVNHQRAVIGRLQAKVRQQQIIINRQRRVIAWQAGRIRDLEGRVAYYRGVVNDLGGHIWGDLWMMMGTKEAIHSGEGISEAAYVYSQVTLLGGREEFLEQELEIAGLTMLGNNYAHGVEIQRAKSMQEAMVGNLNAYMDEYYDVGPGSMLGDVICGYLSLICTAAELTRTDPRVDIYGNPCREFSYVSMTCYSGLA